MTSSVFTPSFSTPASPPITELAFGFLASSVIDSLESESYQTRLCAIKDLITTVQTTATSHVEVDKFLDYMVRFLDDDNIIVAENSCRVIETLCFNLRGNVALYKSHFLRLAVAQLGSRKKFVSIFGHNILHIMLKSISPQTVVSDIFTLTLMSPTKIITDLLNFIAIEVQNCVIHSSILTKYAFIYEDAINSDDTLLVEAVQACLQAIKEKDINSFKTISQRMNVSPNSATTSSANSRILDKSLADSVRTSTKSLSATMSKGNSMNPVSYKRPFLSSSGRNTATLVLSSSSNRAAISQATFGQTDDNEIAIHTSKPGSADDSRAPTSRVTIGNEEDFQTNIDFDDDGINIVDDLEAEEKSSPKHDRLLKLHLTKSQGPNIGNRKKKSHQKTQMTLEEKFNSLIDKMHSKEFAEQNEAVQDLDKNMDIYISYITAHLRDVCAALLGCSGAHRSSLAKNSFACLEKLIKHNNIHVSPLADFISASLLDHVCSQKQYIASSSADCFEELILNIQPQKAIDVLVYASKIPGERARAKVAQGFGLIADSINVFTQPLQALADLVVDECQDVRKNAKMSVAQIAAKCVDFKKIITDFVTDQRSQKNLIDSLAK